MLAMLVATKPHHHRQHGRIIDVRIYKHLFNLRARGKTAFVFLNRVSNLKDNLATNSIYYPEL